MEKLKIAILFWEDCVDGALQHDEVVEEVLEALSESGHKTSLISISDNLRELLDRLDELVWCKIVQGYEFVGEVIFERPKPRMGKCVLALGVLRSANGTIE